MYFFESYYTNYFVNVLITAILVYLVNKATFSSRSKEHDEEKIEHLKHLNSLYLNIDIFIFNLYCVVAPFCFFVINVIMLPVCFFQCINLICDTIEMLVHSFHLYVDLFNKISIL